MNNEMKIKFEEEKIYEAIYWAVRDVFENALEEASRKMKEQNPEASKSSVLLTLVYEAIKEGVYKAFKETFGMNREFLLSLLSKTRVK